MRNITKKEFNKIPLIRGRKSIYFNLLKQVLALEKGQGLVFTRSDLEKEGINKDIDISKSLRNLCRHRKIKISTRNYGTPTNYAVLRIE